MSFIKHAIIAGMLAFSTLNVASAAPILNIRPSDSTLLGASGVNVGGTLYDVTFGDGFLNASSITAFTDSLGAQAATQALLDQVFLGTYANYISISGCTNRFFCEVETPYLFSNDLISTYTAVIFALSNSNSYGVSFLPYDTSDIAHATSARWTPVAAVPEPETYAMMFAGLGLLGFVSRRREQKAAV